MDLLVTSKNLLFCFFKINISPFKVLNRWLFFLCFPALIACSRSPVLLKVENISWTGKDFQKELSLYLKGHPFPLQDTDLIKKKVLEDLVLKSLLEIWAGKNIKDQPKSFSTVAEKYRFFRESLQKHLWRIAPKTFDEKTLRDFYRQHKKSFYQEEQCFLEQILVSKKNFSQALYRRLLKGENFEALVQMYSNDRKEIGWITKGTLKVFDEACETVKEGEFSSPLKSLYGFHILKVRKKKRGIQKTFEESKGEILETMKRESQKTSFQKWLQKELKSSSVFLNEKLLDNIQIRYKKRLL